MPLHETVDGAQAKADAARDAAIAAGTAHSHGDYATAGHGHGDYATAGHTHDGAGHDHDADYQALTEKGQPDGYASLDGTGKVPSAQLPDGGGGGAPLASTAPPGVRSASQVGVSTDAARADHTHAALSQTLFRSGWYTPLAPVTNQTSGYGTNSMDCHPFYVPRQITIDRVVAPTATAGTAGTIRIGIYDDDGTGYPGALRVEFPGLPADQVAPEGTVSHVLGPGIYWIAMVAQGLSGSPTGRNSNSTPLFSLALPTLALATQSSALSAYRVTSVTGAMPNPFPATPSSGASTAWRVAVRVG